MVLRLVRPIIDFALPPRCPGCGAIVDADHRFCAACWNQLEFLTGAGCAACNVPLPLPDGGVCGPCLASPPRHDGVIAAVAYGDVARSVVLALKYGRRPGVARTMAALMAPRLDGSDDAVLIPVPLHRWRLWSRGYNQSLVLAQAIAAHTGHSVMGEALVRRRATPVLRGLNPAQRRKAVKSAFRAHGALDGRKVLLVDDVYTTGATADACTAELKRAGAASVKLLTWARVIERD